MEAAMAEAVHARENGENFSQVRIVLQFKWKSLNQPLERLDLGQLNSISEGVKKKIE